MNKQQEKIVALSLLAYAIGLLVGEAIRDRMYGDKGGEVKVKGADFILDQEARSGNENSTRGYSFF